jgi:hypothetical protein
MVDLISETGERVGIIWRKNRKVRIKKSGKLSLIPCASLEQQSKSINQSNIKTSKQKNNQTTKIAQKQKGKRQSFLDFTKV